MVKYLIEPPEVHRIILQNVDSIHAIMNCAELMAEM